jgi:hypothetical protein
MVLWSNEDLIFIDKPAGMDTQDEGEPGSLQELLRGPLKMSEADDLK